MIKQSEKNVDNVFLVEKAIDSLLQTGAEVITLDDLAQLAPALDDAEAVEKQNKQLIRELNSHEGIVTAVPGEKYIPIAKLFNGREFLITPDGFEIDNNILVPGHRFAIFMSNELFPSEVTLKEAGARKRQSSREFSGQAENIIKYHLLMGAENLFDFFAAEDDENMINARNSANPQLKLTVLDMKKFYQETNFSEGDALLVKVVDFDKGEFEFHLDNGKQRNAKKIEKYRTQFEAVLASVTGELMPGALIIEQLRCAFANAPELLKNPAASLDELLMSDSAFDIAFDEDGSTLIAANDIEESCCEHDHEHGENCSCGCGEDHHHDRRLPDNVTIGSGETGSLETMLAKLYPMLNIVELDAILLDNLKNHDFDFNSFYARSFADTALPFADGLQEACFFNELESRFEEKMQNYPREFDQKSGAIRSLIVEFTIDRCTVLNELSELADSLEIKPELFEALAEVVLLLDESLKLLNAPEALGDDFDFAELRRGVEEALDNGEEALTALRGVLDSDD